MCAVMVLVAAAPLVTGGDYLIVKGDKGPNASAVTWNWSPTDNGYWYATIDNHGLRWLVLDVCDNTTGTPMEILHQRIRFAAYEAYPIGIVYSESVFMTRGSLYEITATPNGPRGTYAIASDTFVMNTPPVAMFTATMDWMMVSADASSSYDLDGTIVDYSWSWGDGTTDTGMAAMHTYSAPGDYLVGLTVTDDLGATDTASETVTAMEKPNEPPTAEFTWTNADLLISVDASTSKDPDGAIVLYTWNWGDGSPDESYTSPSAEHGYAYAGMYPVTLTVTDDDGATGTMTHEVTATMPVDDLPVAAFTYTATELSVDFDASGSTDDYGIVAYDWDFGDGSIGIEMMVNHAYGMDGTYTVVLTVTDTAGQTDTASADVTVATLKAPIADFTATMDWMTLSADATTSSDLDGTIVLHEWDFGDGKTDTGMTVSHEYITEGTFTVILTVTDDDDLTDSAQTEVTAALEPLPPKADFTWGAVDRLASFDGSSSEDLDGTIIAWVWVFGDGAAGSGEMTTHEYTADGTFPVTLTVTDDDGLTGSVTKDVTVKLNNPPEASFTVTADYLIVLVDAGASTDDVGIVSYAWQFGDGGTGTEVVATHTYAGAGTYTVILTVTDGGGKTDSASTDVIVIANPLPTAVIDLVSQTDLTVTVTGAASTDDSMIVSYAWDFGDGVASPDMIATHTYASPGTYTITLVVTDDYGQAGTATLDVTVVLPVVERERSYRVYDMFQEPWGPWWPQRKAYYGTDFILTNAPGENTMIFTPSTRGYQALMYAPYRWSADARNLPNVNVHAPEFMPVLGTATTGAEASMGVYFQYIDDAWYNGYWLPTWGTDPNWKALTLSKNDGYYLGAVISATMNREAALEWMGMPLDANPATWWSANEDAYVTDWQAWIDYEGNERLDIYCGYEYAYVDLSTTMDLTTDAEGNVVLTIGHLSWGYEILMTRWLTETEICVHEPWYEDFTLTATFGEDLANVALDGVAQYGFHAVKAEGTVNSGAWVWEPVRIDYVEGSFAHPTSDYDPYAYVTYQSWNSGDGLFSQDVVYEQTPQWFNLTENDKLTVQLPTGSAIGFKGEGVTTTAITNLRKSGILTPWLDLKQYGSMDLGSYVTGGIALEPFYDPATKTLEIVGPADFDNARHPGGELYHGAPWIEFEVTPALAAKTLTTESSGIVISSGQSTSVNLVALAALVSLIGIVAATLAIMVRKPSE
ncbi:MAG: hypothetical protein A3K75_04310 [Euryarchaeota archaeon RBG_13_61_15]|nr:MAG: hypothetical protein A3K75_04310 [Euryarchaeota archaeon RBG_13_61_15]